MPGRSDCARYLSTSVTVGMGSAEGAEEGAEDLEQAGNAVIEAVEDTEAVDPQDAESAPEGDT